METTIQALIISFREGLEAFLLIGIMLKFLDKTNNQIMVYTMVDMDTNKDGKLDISDIKALYLSEISGERFTKISSDFQELIDWKLIGSNNRLYYRTVEDTNKNGEFDKKDVVNYYYIDLSKKEWKIIGYEPV